MTRVLVFGDSLSTSNGPGVVMARELEARGHTVRINARVSRSAWNFWAREDTLRLMDADRAWKPELVIVWLGTNDIGISSVRTRDGLVRIRDAYEDAGAKVVAIGPPAFAELELREGSLPVYATMGAVFGDVVDARPRSLDLREAPYRAGDGVHFTARGAEVLGVRLADEITAPSSPWWVAGVALVLALLFATLSGGTNTMS